MKKFFLFLIICLNFTCLQAQESTDDWIGYWINGIEFTKGQQNYPQAIENYSTAINRLTPAQVTVQLNVVNERGSVYFNMLDFNNAIKDFSFVLDHPQVTQEQKIEALWGRSKAYLAMGKIQEFEKDHQQLEQLQALVTPITENKDYAIIKMNPFVLRDKISHEQLVHVLKAHKIIKSEKDVTFTPSGFIIVKKQ